VAGNRKSRKLSGWAAGGGVLRRGVRRHLYLVAGFVSLGLAVIGALLPVMPTTVFVILAAWCFARSSPALERRLLDHPAFGPHILRWRERGAISRKGKVAATIAFAVSILIGAIFAPWPWSLAPVAAALVIGGWIWSRPEA
jgi:uncharacterized membrane protein YbaN (DUF454 family)